MMFLDAACIHRCMKFALKMEFCLFGTDFSAWNFLILIKIYGEKTPPNSSNTCRFSVFIPRRSVAFGTRKMFHVCTRGMKHSDHVISSIWLAAFFHFVYLRIFASNLFCPQHSYGNIHTSDEYFVHLICLFFHWMIVVHGIFAAVMRFILVKCNVISK